MSDYVIIVKNRINNEINSCQSAIKRAERTIGIVDKKKSKTTSDEIARDKATILLIRESSRLENLQERLQKILSGDLSEAKAMKSSAFVTGCVLRKEEKDKGSIRAVKIKAKKKKKDETYKKRKAERRQTNWDKKKYRIYQQKFFRAAQTLPRYIASNLERMPSNKGYTWRGVHFYGHELPEKDQPLILFEKRYKILWIHKYYPDRYEKYKKTNKKVELVLKEMRRIPYGSGIVPPGGREIKYASAKTRKDWQSRPATHSRNSRNSRNSKNRGRRDNHRNRYLPNLNSWKK